MGGSSFVFLNWTSWTKQLGGVDPIPTGALGSVAEPRLSFMLGSGDS